MTRARSRLAKAALTGLTGSALLFGAVESAAAAERSSEQLTQVIDGLDTAVFDAFNSCADPARLVNMRPTSTRRWSSTTTMAASPGAATR